MLRLFKKLRADAAGMVPIEQGLFIAVICVGGIVAIELLGTTVGIIMEMFLG